MKTLLFMLALCLVCSPALATHRTAPQTVGLRRPNANYTFMYSQYRVDTGASMSSGTSFSNYTYDNTANTGSGTVPAFTGAVKFRVRVYAWLNSSTYVDLANYLSYDDADGNTDNDNNKEVVQAPDGTYAPGQGGNMAGQGPSSGGEGKYTAGYRLTNTGPGPAVYHVNTFDDDGNLVSSNTYNVASGETKDINQSSSSPFTWEITKTTSDGDGGVNWDPTVTVNAKPEASGGSATGGGGNGQITSSSSGGAGTNGTGFQARPGTTEGNAEARNTELRGDVQQVSQNVKQSADRITGSINDQTSDLGGKLSNIAKEIKDGVGDLLEGLEGDGEGGSGGEGTDMSGVEGLLTVTGDNPTAPSTAGGITTISQGLAVLGADMQALQAKLTPFGGSTPLSWTLSFYGKSHTINLETFSGIFDSARMACLVWVAYQLVWAGLGILRGAFTDEGR